VEADEQLALGLVVLLEPGAELLGRGEEPGLVAQTGITPCFLYGRQAAEGRRWSSDYTGMTP
jgi:hypothetical protein